jgi:hypothetical protein
MVLAKKNLIFGVFAATILLGTSIFVTVHSRYRNARNRVFQRGRLLGIILAAFDTGLSILGVVFFVRALPIRNEN